MGKFCGAAKVPRGNSEISAPPKRQNLFRQPRVLLGIDDVDAGAEHGDGLAFGRDGAAMAGGIDSAGHPTDNDQSLGRKVAGQTLGHAGSVGRGMARSDDRNAGLRQQFGIPAHIKKKRWIVDFFQPRRVQRVVQSEDVHLGIGGSGDLLPRQFRRLSRGHGLRRNGLNAGAFQFGQRGAEDCLRRSEMFDQLSRPGWTQSRRQRERDPREKICGSG